MQIHFYVFGRELVSGDQIRYETLCGAFVENAQLALAESEVTCQSCRDDLEGPEARLQAFLNTRQAFPHPAAARPSVPAQYMPTTERRA